MHNVQTVYGILAQEVISAMVAAGYGKPVAPWVNLQTQSTTWNEASRPWQIRVGQLVENKVNDAAIVVNTRLIFFEMNILYPRIGATGIELYFEDRDIVSFAQMTQQFRGALLTVVLPTALNPGDTGQIQTIEVLKIAPITKTDGSGIIHMECIATYTGY